MDRNQADSNRTLEVTVNSDGEDLDRNGYVLKLDESTIEQVGRNGTASFSDVTPGEHVLTVLDIAPNCSIRGANPRAITIPDSGATTTVHVTCTASEATSGAIIAGIRFDFSTHQRAAMESDNWPATWSDDDHQYAFGGDGWGFCGFSEKKSWMAARIRGDFDSHTIFDRLGGDCADHATTLEGKTHGSPISIRGDIYWWHTPGSGSAGYARSTLRKSTDKLQSVSEFAAVEFTLSNHKIAYLGWVNHGKDNQHGDGYHYAIGIEPGTTDEIFTSMHDSIFLLRVAEGQIENQAAYQWFTGIDIDGNPGWGPIMRREPIYQQTDTIGTWPQMIFVPSLARYVLTVETGGSTSDLLVLESLRPWGPWTIIHAEQDWGAVHGIEKSVFQWQFAPKWFRNDGTQFTMIFSGFGENDSWNTIDGSFDVIRPSGAVIRER